MADMKIPQELSHEKLVGMYKTMLKIHRAEESIAEGCISKEIICPCHLYIGEEAVAAGVCSELEKNDYVFSSHRSHGHYLAKGGDLNKMMAEIYGKVTGCSGGRGGSMHIASPEMGLPGSSAIVSGTISLAVGSALAFSMQNKKAISVAFFGDGAVDEGVFYESLNLASLYKLPVIFVCENNLCATHLPISACLADTDIFKKAKVFNMPGIKVDGNNVLEVYKAAKEAIENARCGNGPALIECMTYRWRGHVGPNDDLDKEVYLFNWEDVPGNDNMRILRYLSDDLKIDWVKNAVINKTPDNKIITVSNGEKSLRFELKLEENKVILELDKSGNYEYKLKLDGGNINIYSRLRTKEELDCWISRCPIKSLEELLLKYNIMSEAEKIQIQKDIEKEVEKAVSFAKESPYPDESTLLDNVFKT